MSSSHSFRLLLVLVVLVLSAGAVAGVTVDDERSPGDAQVGSTVQASYTLTQLYQDPTYESWTLSTETELRNVTWTFQLVDQAGNVVETTNADGPNATQPIALEDGVSEVTVQVTGTVPAIEEFAYEPAPTFLVAELTHTREGGATAEIDTYEARHYTAESREARDAIESAEASIDAAGGNEQAEESLQSAISAYEGENFENAVQLAERAEREAGQAQQAQQRNQLILYGVVALIVVVLLIGVVYWFMNRDTPGRL